MYDDWGRTTQSTDVLGVVSTSVYDDITGLMNTFTSKGNTVTYSYDAWRRVTQASGTDGTIRNTSYLWETDNNTSIVYMVRESGNNSPTSTVHYDAAGRELLRDDIRFNGQSRKISREYDSQGRLYRISQPYFSSASKWETYSYDGYDRITQITSPTGEITSYSYSNNTVTETVKGVSSIKTFDGSGQLISISDPAGTITYNLRPDGQPSSIVAPGNITTSFDYDSYGRQTQISDPSAGVKNFTYDEAGNLWTETDAAGRTITMTYDQYHRLATKLNAENVSTTYGYDSYGSVISEVSLNGTSRGFTYDDFNRLESMRETIMDNHWLEVGYTYENGQVWECRYTSQNGLIGSEIYGYSNGYHVSTRWGTSGPYFFQLNSENVYGQPENAFTGAVTRIYTYNAAGVLTERRALASASGATLMNLGYQFDPLKGNLQNRTDKTRSITESFLYDNLNRLTNYGSNSVSYDIKGNILTKSDAGQMAYNHSTKPYAVTDVITSVVPSGNQNITYNSQMRPATITENGYVAAFTYDVSGERVKTHITNNGSLFLTRYYIGGVYEFDQTASTTREKLYLGGDYYSAPVVMVKTGTGSWTFFNILRDHLGSIIKVTDVAGTQVAEYSYDAWGRMRNPNSQEVYAVGSEPELFLGRGYTGHEHLPMFGLINMNARLYDPVLGRFLSPDSYVQDPELTQNYNRYAYCLNNPLLYVDIDGYTWLSKLGKWIDKNATQIITIAATVVVVGVVTVATAGMGTIVAGAIIGAAGGFTSGAVGTWLNGGSFWQGMGAGALSAGIGAIGGMAGGAAFNWASKNIGGFLLNSLEMQGQSAIGGFISGTIGGAFGSGVSGFAVGYIMTGDVQEAWQMAKKGALTGGITGGILGGYRGYKDAKVLGNNPWTGKGWPTPPGDGPFTSGTPSRAKAAARGERSLFDKHGGEWRYDAKGHQPDYKPHWDYKAPGNNKPWENIYNNLKLKK